MSFEKTDIEVDMRDITPSSLISDRFSLENIFNINTFTTFSLSTNLNITAHYMLPDKSNHSKQSNR